MFDRIKYESTLVTFTEVPDEISLCLNISGCPCYCEGCFEPWLREDCGDTLTYDVLAELIKKHPHITCLCFMGGDRYYQDMADLIKQGKKVFPKLKWAMYSGRQEMNSIIEPWLDIYKVGPYIAAAGPLNVKTTNQIYYVRENGAWIDKTYLFQKEKI